MIINRENYLDEELKLIISTISEAIDKNWDTKMLRRFAAGESSLMNNLYQELLRIELFNYLQSTELFNNVIVNELIGSKLLPGIISLTAIAVKAIKDEEILEGIYSGEIKVAFSDSNLVPAADLADVIIIGKNFAWKEESEVEPFDSLDNSMKICMVKFKKAEVMNIDQKILLLNLSSQLVGAAEEVLNMGIEYAKKRIAFGKPIGSFQAIKHKLVDDAITIELSRSLCLEASRDQRYVEIAKYYASKRLIKVIMDGIQVHGGIGFTDDVDIHLYLRRALTLGRIYSKIKPSIPLID